MGIPIVGLKIHVDVDADVDVTKWRRAFLLWKKPEEKLSKMADVQIKKNNHRFWTLFVTFDRKNSLLLLLTSNLSFSYSFKLHNKI